MHVVQISSPTKDKITRTQPNYIMRIGHETLSFTYMYIYI